MWHSLVLWLFWRACLLSTVVLACCLRALAAAILRTVVCDMSVPWYLCWLYLWVSSGFFVVVLWCWLRISFVGARGAGSWIFRRSAWLWFAAVLWWAVSGVGARGACTWLFRWSAWLWFDSWVLWRSVTGVGSTRVSRWTVGRPGSVVWVSRASRALAGQLTVISCVVLVVDRVTDVRDSICLSVGCGLELARLWYACCLPCLCCGEVLLHHLCCSLCLAA